MAEQLMYRVLDEPIQSPDPGIKPTAYRVIKETEYTYLIQWSTTFEIDPLFSKDGTGKITIAGKPRRMMKHAKCPFAHPTKEEAIQAYMRRKNAHVIRLGCQLEVALWNYRRVQKLTGSDRPNAPWTTQRMMQIIACIMEGRDDGN